MEDSDIVVPKFGTVPASVSENGPLTVPLALLRTMDPGDSATVRLTASYGGKSVRKERTFTGITADREQNFVFNTADFTTLGIPDDELNIAGRNIKLVATFKKNNPAPPAYADASASISSAAPVAITDDESGGSSIALTVEETSREGIPEAGNRALRSRVFTLTGSAPPAVDTTFTVSVTGTATPGADWEAFEGRGTTKIALSGGSFDVVLEAGETEAEFSLRAVNDVLVEPEETLIVNFTQKDPVGEPDYLTETQLSNKEFTILPHDKLIFTFVTDDLTFIGETNIHELAEGQSIEMPITLEGELQDKTDPRGAAQC